jgi:hypothetical protein
MTTFLDVVSRSLRLLGVLASGEVPDGAQGQDALAVMNRVVDDFKLESLLVYAIDRIVFPLTAGLQTYAVGTGATWSTPRPVRVEQASWQDNSLTPVLELPLRPLTDEEYEGIRIRTETSTQPTHFYYDQAYPAGNMFFYPAPTLARNIVLYPWHQLAGNYGLADVVAFPPGYQSLLEYALAVELAPEYGVTPSPIVTAMAGQSKAKIKSQNMASPLMTVDPALLKSGARGSYNWRTD